MFKKFYIWIFCDHNFGVLSVRNYKKGYVYTSHLTLNPDFPENKVPNGHSLPTH